MGMEQGKSKLEKPQIYVKALPLRDREEVDDIKGSFIKLHSYLTHNASRTEEHRGVEKGCRGVI
jgi:hypothetical protein